MHWSQRWLSALANNASYAHPNIGKEIVFNLVKDKCTRRIREK